MLSRRQFMTAVPIIGMAGVAASSSSAAVRAYPTKPIHVVVPFTAGGGADIVARVVLQQTAALAGQSFVVENRAGAGGIIGTDFVAKAAPDGYTLLMGQTGPIAINPALYPKLPYDPVRDFAPITQTTAYPYVVVVSPSVAVKNLKEFMALVASHPGKLAFGSAGTGSSTQLAAELFLHKTQLHMIHVPYKGTSAALTDVMGGRVTVMFADITSTAPLIKAGKLRALAVTSTRRSPLFPDVPTVAEVAVPGYEASAWHGFLAPGGVPGAIVAQLNAAFVAALKSQKLKDRFAQDGIEVVGSTPEQFARYIKQEIVKWAQAVREAGIKPA